MDRSVFFDLGRTLSDESRWQSAVARAYVDALGEHGVQIRLEAFLSKRDAFVRARQGVPRKP